MSWPDEIELVGAHASLTPLRAEHAPALAEAVRDGELWRLWYTFVASPEDMAADIERRLALRQAGQALPFTVMVEDRPIGLTAYLNIDADNRRLEIGSTWYRASLQRTAVNTECKRLLLAHAFEALDCIAVEFRTHRLNHRSRAAIERLGAKLDGVLRHHSRMPNGTLRDTCVYSIIAAEWPTVRANLDARLSLAAPVDRAYPSLQ